MEQNLGNTAGNFFSQVSPFQFTGNSLNGGFLPLAWTGQFLQSRGSNSVMHSGLFSGSPFSDVLDTLSQMAQAGASEETLDKASSNTVLETEINPEELFNITGMHLPTMQSLLGSQNPNEFSSKEDDKKPVEVGLSDVFRWDQNWVTQISPQLAQQLPQQMQPMAIALQSPQSFNPEFVQQMQKAFQKQQPIRVSINQDVSVIFKFAHDGTMSAAFLAANPQVSLLLKEQLSQLQQHLQSKALPYVELTVRDQQKQQQQQQNQNQQQYS